MSELKPCPFCGSEAEAVYYNGALTICCPACNKYWDLEGKRPGERWAADFGFYGWGEEDDGAVIAAWNRRAIDIDELLAVADECDDADVDGISDWAERIRKAVGV